MANKPPVETERAAVGALLIEALQTLRSDAAFLRHYLENYTVSVQTKDERGYVVNGFAAAQIPTWAVRQRLDDIDHSIVALADHPPSAPLPSPRPDASESGPEMASPTEGHGANLEDDGMYSVGGLIGDIEELEKSRADCGCGLGEKCPMLPHERKIT